MEKLGGSGSDNPSHTSNNIRVPLQHIPKYKKIPLSNGQLAFGNKWIKLSPHLTTASDHIFSRLQLNNEPCLRKPQEVSNNSSEWSSESARNLQTIHYNNSVGFVQERIGQKLHGYVTAASVNKDSQYKQRQFGPNDGPLEALHTAENCLHQKYTKTSAVNYIINGGTCSSTCISIQHPNVSSASMIPDVSQKSIVQMTVLNAKHLSGNWKNFSNQHVNTGNNMSTDHIQQKMHVENGGIEPVVILTPAQNIFLQQDICMSKENRQQKCVSQKAIAVVTPLTQGVVTGDLYSGTLTQEKKCLEDKSVPCEKGQEHCIPHPLQITTRESGLKSLLDEAQTDISHKSSSESIQTRGFAQHEEAKGQAGPKECWNQSERLCTVSLNSISGETKGKTQSSHMAHQSSALENVTAINHRFEDTETRMDMELPNMLTAIPVTEWSLHKLHTLISDLEQMQIRHQKDKPFSNVKREILKLFWNGEYTQLYEASKTNLYRDIMNEVRLHSETRDSVILREIPKEKLNKIASDIHILKHDGAPPKMVYKSSWLNLNVKLDDTDKEYDYPPAVTTSRSMSRIDEVLVKKQKKLEEGENEKANGTNKLRENAEQSKPLAPGYEKNTSATRDMMLKKLSETVGQERACLSQTTSVNESRNVTLKMAPSEEKLETYGKNAETWSISSIGDQLPVFLRTKSVAGRDHKTIKQGFERLTTEMTDEILDKEKKKLKEGENENANGTNKLREDAEQSKRLAPRNEKVLSATADNVLRKPESMDVENDWTNWLRETKGQERANLSQTTSDDESRNEITKRAPSEEMVETCGKNAETNSGMSSSIGVHLPVSLCKKSVSVSDYCTTIKQGFELLTTEMTALLVKSEIADDQDVSACLKINTLSPKKAKKMFFGDPIEEADQIQTVTDIKTVTATEGVEKYNQKSEDEKYMKAEMKSGKRKERIRIEMQLEEYCCMAKWFKSLGYRNGGHCQCAKKPVLSHTSGRSVNEADTDNYRRMGNNSNGFGSIMADAVDEIKKVQIISNYEDILKLANAVSEQLMDAPLVTCQSQEFTKNSKRFKSDTNGKKRKYGTSCGQHLSNMSFPLPSIDNANPPFDEKGREITKPESKMEDKIINLALYGSSPQKAREPMTTARFPKKRLSEIGFSDNVPPPPKTLNVKISSGQNRNLSSTRNKNAKQHLINAQTKSCVPSNSFPFKRRPNMLKCTKWHAESKEGSEGNSAETTGFDVIRGLLSHEDQQTPRSESVNSKNAVPLTSADQQKIARGRTMKNRHSTQLGKRLKRLKKQKWISALFNRTRRQNYANEPRKGLRSPFKQPHTNSLSKGELNKGLALNFKVLPESFSLPGCRSSVETQPPLSTDTGSNAKTSTLKRPWGPPGAWCVSPRKMQHFNSTETADVSGSSSTFQEFKKRYQEKKLRLPP